MSDNVIIKIGGCHQEETIFFPLQIYLDVDCSKITSASPVSASISTAMAAVDAEMANSAAANRTKEALESWCDSWHNTLEHISPFFFIKFVFLVRFLLRLATREGSLAFSLLDKIDPGKVAVDEIKEAFCRDVDNLDLKPQVCSLLYICSQTRDVTDQVPQQKGR